VSVVEVGCPVVTGSVVSVIILPFLELVG